MKTQTAVLMASGVVILGFAVGIGYVALDDSVEDPAGQDPSPETETASPTTQAPGDGNADPPQYFETRISVYPYNTETNSISVEVDIAFKELEEFERKRLYLCSYDDTGRVLNRTTFWMNSTQDDVHYQRKTVTIGTDRRPKYLTLYNRELYNHSEFFVNTIVWDPENERYFREFRDLADLQDEFPYPRRNDSRKCG